MRPARSRLTGRRVGPSIEPSVGSSKPTMRPAWPRRTPTCASFCVQPVSRPSASRPPRRTPLGPVTSSRRPTGSQANVVRRSSATLIASLSRPRSSYAYDRVGRPPTSIDAVRPRASSVESTAVPSGLTTPITRPAASRRLVVVPTASPTEVIHPTGSYPNVVDDAGDEAARIGDRVDLTAAVPGVRRVTALAVDDADQPAGGVVLVR